MNKFLPFATKDTSDLTLLTKINAASSTSMVKTAKIFIIIKMYGINNVRDYVDSLNNSLTVKEIYTKIISNYVIKDFNLPNFASFFYYHSILDDFIKTEYASSINPLLYLYLWIIYHHNAETATCLILDTEIENIVDTDAFSVVVDHYYIFNHLKDYIKIKDTDGEVIIVRDKTHLEHIVLKILLEDKGDLFYTFQKEDPNVPF